eukprot:1324647-Pyramimonas_sp.AAC.1
MRDSFGARPRASSTKPASSAKRKASRRDSASGLSPGIQTRSCAAAHWRRSMSRSTSLSRLSTWTPASLRGASSSVRQRGRCRPGRTRPTRPPLLDDALARGPLRLHGARAAAAPGRGVAPARGNHRDETLEGHAGAQDRGRQESHARGGALQIVDLALHRGRRPGVHLQDRPARQRAPQVAGGFSNMLLACEETEDAAQAE